MQLPAHSSFSVKAVEDFFFGRVTPLAAQNRSTEYSKPECCAIFVTWVERGTLLLTSVTSHESFLFTFTIKQCVTLKTRAAISGRLVSV